MLKGGDTRPAIVPGDPEKSLLIEAIQYGNTDLQMPPKTKLSEPEITALSSWVKMGAPWPSESKPVATSAKKKFDLDARRREQWCWQPISNPTPPAVTDRDWSENPVDQFIRAKLEVKGLKPAPPADRRTLIRRVYFYLIGLPPAPEAVEAFVNSRSPHAYEALVDELLASPRFGERWARHWLDLVRYAETLGHEFDYPLPSAWRYRDYVIRAFNADVPYDQFVTEQIAGDLLANPRRHPTEGFNESMIGTTFYWMCQQSHSPVDLRQHQSEFIENQIDVATKTFLGLTVSCARCNDHKFDAISTRDYYSLYGIFDSSRYAQRAIDPPYAVEPKVARLRTLKAQIRDTIGQSWARQAAGFGPYVLAAATAQKKRLVQQKLDAARLEKWERALTNLPPARAETETAGTGANPPVSLVDFSVDGYRGWFPDGPAFGSAPSGLGDFQVGAAQNPITSLALAGWANSASLSRRLEGALRSSTFVIKQRYLHVFAAGHAGRISVVIDNFTLIRDPIYGGLKRVVDTEQPRWFTIDLDMWQGHRAYLEFSDRAVVDLADADRPGGYGDDAYIAVQRAVFSGQSTPPAVPLNFPTVLAGIGKPETKPKEIARRIRRAANEAIAAWRTNGLAQDSRGREQSTLLNWLLTHNLLNSLERDHEDIARAKLEGLVAEYRQIETSLPRPICVPAMADGTGCDEAIFVRGSPKTLGQTAPRGFLEAIAGTNQPPIAQGSGRRELARYLTAADNPLTARVMVNRIWEHLFGVGIVPTPDNFGVLGKAPTHPELLDWLATRYRQDGWSTKKMIRLLVTSRAYQMSSQAADAEAEAKDPNDEWLHRMRLKRLEGEIIRDAILDVSGRLETSMYGPSVPVHLTAFMDGRGKPDHSGPLDGAGRRSIYQEVRRNFLSPFMLAFDAPIPASTTGKRNLSNLPAQALILMNDPFVIDQAQVWAHRLAETRSWTPEQRIARMYQMAFGRPPSGTELADSLGFLRRQADAYGAGAEPHGYDKRAWADLSHVLFNVKEFVFVN